MSLTAPRWGCCLVSTSSRRGTALWSTRSSSGMLFLRVRWVSATHRCSPARPERSTLNCFLTLTTSWLRTPCVTSLWPPSLSSTPSPTRSATLKLDRSVQSGSWMKWSDSVLIFHSPAVCPGHWHRCRSAVSYPLHAAGGWQGGQLVAQTPPSCSEHEVSQWCEASRDGQRHRPVCQRHHWRGEEEMTTVFLVALLCLHFISSEVCVSVQEEQNAITKSWFCCN